MVSLWFLLDGVLGVLKGSWRGAGLHVDREGAAIS